MKNHRYYIFDAYSKLVYTSHFNYGTPEIARSIAKKHILIAQLTGKRNWLYVEVT